MYRYDNSFWEGEVFTSKASVVHAFKWKKFTSCHTRINQIISSQMFSLSVWCIFNRSAVFCIFIIANSQLGFIVCEGFFWRWKSMLCSGVYVKTSNALQLFYFSHTVEFISILIMCSLFICMILWRLYDDNSWSLPAHRCCAAHSSVGLFFHQNLINCLMKWRTISTEWKIKNLCVKSCFDRGLYGCGMPVFICSQGDLKFLEVLWQGFAGMQTENRPVLKQSRALHEWGSTVWGCQRDSEVYRLNWNLELQRLLLLIILMRLVNLFERFIHWNIAWILQIAPFKKGTICQNPITILVRFYNGV